MPFEFSLRSREDKMVSESCSKQLVAFTANVRALCNRDRGESKAQLLSGP